MYFSFCAHLLCPLWVLTYSEYKYKQSLPWERSKPTIFLCHFCFNFLIVGLKIFVLGQSGKPFLVHITQKERSHISAHLWVLDDVITLSGCISNYITWRCNKYWQKINMLHSISWWVWYRASVHFLLRPAGPRLCLSCQPHHQMHHHHHHHHHRHHIISVTYLFNKSRS